MMTRVEKLRDRARDSSSNLQIGLLFRIIGDRAECFLQSRVKTNFRRREQWDQYFLLYRLLYCFLRSFTTFV
jgi:hypothetical protein